MPFTNLYTASALALYIGHRWNWNQILKSEWLINKQADFGVKVLTFEAGLGSHKLLLYVESTETMQALYEKYMGEVGYKISDRPAGRPRKQQL